MIGNLLPLGEEHFERLACNRIVAPCDDNPVFGHGDLGRLGHAIIVADIHLLAEVVPVVAAMDEKDVSVATLTHRVPHHVYIAAAGDDLWASGAGGDA